MVNSPGGSVQEGDLISDFIRSHATRFDSVMNSGDVASIAANVFLALPYEKRFFDLRKGLALIHQPYIQANEITEDLTSDKMIFLAAQMKETQDNVKKYIAKQTGADADVVEALMAINEPLSEAQLQSINFANIVKFQPIATFKKKDDMTDLKEIKEGLDKIFAFLKPTQIVALMLTDANGASIEFPEVPEGSMPQVGDKVSAPDGEVVMADGYTYVIVGGELTEIKEPVIEEVEDMEALKAEIEQLKAENETLKASTAQMTEIKAQVVALQGKIKSQMIDDAPTQKEVETQSTKFQYNGRKK
jgi:ATP-dependent protease ClpP protease subunit